MRPTGSVDAKMRSIDTLRSRFTVPGLRPELAGLGAPGLKHVWGNFLVGGDPGVPGVLGAAAGTATGVGPVTISVMSRRLALGRGRDRSVRAAQDRQLEP